MHWSPTEFIGEKDSSAAQRGDEELTHSVPLFDGRGSYGLKHDVENWSDTYISNGALIAAALGLSCEYEVAGPNLVLSAGTLRRPTLVPIERDGNAQYRPQDHRERVPFQMATKVPFVVAINTCGTNDQ